MLWCVLLAILFNAGQSTNEGTEPFRIIPIPKREFGYGDFGSMVLMSENDMDSFLKKTFTRSWNDRQEFEDALHNAKLDFTKEALVLLRHTEGSGSVEVIFEKPVLQDSKLLCEIRGIPIPPGYGGTTDVADYCFAVAVSKSRVSLIELQRIEGGFSERRLAPLLLPIIEKEPVNMPLEQTVTENQVRDCPRITVTCPEAGPESNTRIRFSVSVNGVKRMGDLLYNWSVSKGTISGGQGTAAIEVEATVMDQEGITATVEIGGIDPNCPRAASCSMVILSPGIKPNKLSLTPRPKILSAFFLDQGGNRFAGKQISYVRGSFLTAGPKR